MTNRCFSVGPGYTDDRKQSLANPTEEPMCQVTKQRANIVTLLITVAVATPGEMDALLEDSASAGRQRGYVHGSLH